MALEDELRELVKADGRTQSEIATAAGIHAVNLSQFMSGARSLPLKTLQRLAEILGVQITVRNAPKRNSQNR